MQKLHAFFHRSLKRLSSGDQSHAAGALVDDGLFDGVLQIRFSFGGAAGIDQTDLSQVAIDDLITGQVDRMIRRKFFLNELVRLAEFQCIVTAVIRRQFLFDNIRFDRHTQMVTLSGQIRGRMKINAVFFEIRIPQIAPKDGEQTQLMRLLEGFRNFHDLPGGLVGTEINRGSDSSGSHSKGLLHRGK